MTQKEAKKFLPLIQALADGKIIQLKTDNTWIDIDCPKFTCDPYLYRIKPGPRYRPFKNTEECFEEMKKHNNIGWLKSNCKDLNIHISSIKLMESGELSFVTTGFHGVEQIESSVMLKSFTFMDGSPFGIVEDEYYGL